MVVFVGGVSQTNIFVNAIRVMGNTKMSQALPSNLNMSNAAALKSALEALIASNASSTHCDLSHVDRIGFGCAQILLAAKKTAISKGCDLKFSLSDDLKSTLGFLGILSIIDQ